MLIDIDGRKFNLVWQDRRDLGGSSIVATELLEGVEEEILMVFCNDYSNKLTLTLYLQELPIEIVERAFALARLRLPEDPEESE